MPPLRTTPELLLTGLKVIAVAQLLEIPIIGVAFFGGPTAVLVLALSCTGLSSGIAVTSLLALRQTHLVLQDAANSSV